LRAVISIAPGQFARGDLDRHAHDPDAAVALEMPTSLRRHPAHHAVFLADGAVFHVVERAPRRVGGRRKRGDSGGAVVGMQPVMEVAHRHRHLGRDAEHRLRPRRPDQRIAHEVDVPEAHVAGLRGKAQAFLALGERGFGRLADGQVQHRADHPQRLAHAAPQHGAAVEHGGETAVGAAEPVLAVPRGSTAFDHGMDVPVHARPVVRMDVIQPPLCAGLAQRMAEQRGQCFVPDDLAIGDAPVPDRIIGGVGGQPITLLHFQMAGLGGLAVGDVQ